MTESIMNATRSYFLLFYWVFWTIPLDCVELFVAFIFKIACVLCDCCTWFYLSQSLRCDFTNHRVSVDPTGFSQPHVSSAQYTAVTSTVNHSVPPTSPFLGGPPIAAPLVAPTLSSPWHNPARLSLPPPTAFQPHPSSHSFASMSPPQLSLSTACQPASTTANFTPFGVTPYAGMTRQSLC